MEVMARKPRPSAPGRTKQIKQALLACALPLCRRCLGKPATARTLIKSGGGVQHPSSTFTSFCPRTTSVAEREQSIPPVA